MFRLVDCALYYVFRMTPRPSQVVRFNQYTVSSSSTTYSAFISKLLYLDVYGYTASIPTRIIFVVGPRNAPRLPVSCFNGRHSLDNRNV